MAYSEGSIQAVLEEHYKKSAKYCLSNMFVFDWESDIFVLQRSTGYSYDIEIKISRPDFFNDFKKWEKHSVISQGKKPYATGTNTDGSRHYEYRDHSFRPNKFYFCVPDGLVSIKEIPNYCGLMYIVDMGTDHVMKIVKEAPFLHKNKLKYASVLCDKFFYRWRDAVKMLRISRKSYKQLESNYNQLKQKYNDGI